MNLSERQRELELIKQINLPLSEKIGNRLKMIRGKISQDELAGMIKTDRQNISYWETGTHRLSVENLIKICTALNITTCDFFKKF